MHHVFEQMKSVRYAHGGTVQVRASVWADWMRQITTDIQPQLDAAQHLVDQGFTAEAAPTEAQPMAPRTRRSA